jgi:trans-aconitate methyltransferase
MLNDDVPFGHLLRTLVLEVHSALAQSVPHADAIRELMWRTAALKGWLRREPSNDVMRYLDQLERRIARAYAPSPTPNAHLATHAPGRHAA